MAYSVKEIYYTLQGEGVQTGRGAVFLRFAGCNLWSGREEDRVSAICSFCDTDFVGTDGPGGGKFHSAEALATAVAAVWRDRPFVGSGRFVVCTGGEPMLQLDASLISALHRRGFEIAIETNGTIAVPGEVDWICVSPKSGAELVQQAGDELKLVYPQRGIAPEQFEAMDFKNFSLQPMDNREKETNTRLALEYCLANPKWRLSIQIHKVLNIP